jgi:hypothetical protein
MIVVGLGAIAIHMAQPLAAHFKPCACTAKLRPCNLTGHIIKLRSPLRETATEDVSTSKLPMLQRSVCPAVG